MKASALLSACLGHFSDLGTVFGMPQQFSWAQLIFETLTQFSSAPPTTLAPVLSVFA